MKAQPEKFLKNLPLDRSTQEFLRDTTTHAPTHKLHEKYAKSQNVMIQRVDINEEVLLIIPKYATAKDARLRRIQGTLTRGPLPLLRAAELLHVKKGGKQLDNADYDNSSELCMDMVSMRAHANKQLNDFQRGIINPTLKRRLKTQNCAKFPKTNISKLLLRENIGDRINVDKQNN